MKILELSKKELDALTTIMDQLCWDQTNDEGPYSFDDLFKQMVKIHKKLINLGGEID